MAPSMSRRAFLTTLGAMPAAFTLPVLPIMDGQEDMVPSLCRLFRKRMKELDDALRTDCNQTIQVASENLDKISEEIDKTRSVSVFGCINRFDLYLEYLDFWCDDRQLQLAVEDISCIISGRVNLG